MDMDDGIIFFDRNEKRIWFSFTTFEEFLEIVEKKNTLQLMVVESMIEAREE